jgi:hypothetical protein
MTQRKPRPRCTSINITDGTQCGRRCHDGISPAQCNIHRALANGGNISPNTPVKKTPRERIEKIAATDGHPNQMQALKLLLDQQELDQKQSVEDVRWREFNRRATLDQWDELRILHGRIKDVFDLAARQPLRPDMVSDEAKARADAERSVEMGERVKAEREVWRHVLPDVKSSPRMPDDIEDDPTFEVVLPKYK